MNTQMVIDFQNTEYDINSLFNFSFNFEQLKYLLLSLVRTQKQTTEKINELEGLIEEKEERISELEKQSYNQDGFLNSQYTNKKSIKIEGGGGIGTGRRDSVKKIK